MTITIRKASKGDLDAISEILAECSSYTKSLGYEIWWPIPFPRNEVSEAIERNEAFVAEMENRIIATFQILWSDLKFWGTRPPKAGYLHKLALKRRFAHRKIGPEIINWVENYVAGNGRSVLRLDCQAANLFIVGYYEAQGFRKIGIRTILANGEERRYQLMEKTLRTSSKILNQSIH